MLCGVTPMRAVASPVCSVLLGVSLAPSGGFLHKRRVSGLGLCLEETSRPLGWGSREGIAGAGPGALSPVSTALRRLRGGGRVLSTVT